jgi:hypothetical protein
MGGAATEERLSGGGGFQGTPKNAVQGTTKETKARERKAEVF